ncbi:uncharacterized protein LOC107046464 isoform X2 [Diachasma alloeum]|uniref:uncharacterized protein LOC107046464 isoform X2 n=2 Tax=Diachasma alloeum TaxID=454923 RepID=UPI0007384E97|nr:uncharacterized protein LOC107046464 isoform X2 [Diachasma alloeum]
MADNDSPTPHCSHTEPRLGSQEPELLLSDPANTRPASSPSSTDSPHLSADPRLPSTESNFFTDVDLLTPSNYIQNISSSTTKLVEMVGIIHLIREAETVTCKNGTQNEVCTFCIHNNDGEIVQCVMWGDTIDRFLDQLLVHHVIHIDGAYPKFVKDQFNSGTVPYELIVQSNTEITDLGKIQATQRSQSTSPEIIPLINLPTCKKIVAIRGFVETPWAVIEKQMESTGNTCYGSIAAQKYFVDVKINDFPAKFVCPYSKGQHVQCVGKLIRNGNSFFFNVQNSDCISLVDQTMATLKDLLLCQPLANLNSSTLHSAGGSSQPKKLKRNELFAKRFPKKG